MMKKMKSFIPTLTALLLLFSTSIFAQTQEPDFMRSLGKIYVVIAVIVAIFIGIVIFLIYLDRRLTKLERDNFE
ncbi:MAG: CcmD family protein [Saprospiraceae bacterium]|jgi:CcmD family protein